MENKVAVLAIVVENIDSVGKLNALLHEYSAYIIGRMGLPYPAKKLNVISVAMDAPYDVINAVAGKIGRLPGVYARSVCAGMPDKDK